MPRLIDADALVRQAIDRYKEMMGTDIGHGMGVITSMIIDAPTIDAVVLPCEIGETVFCILHAKNEIVEDVVEDYDIWSIKDGIKLRLSLLNHNDYVVGEFGKTVFLTREEAKATLAKMEVLNNAMEK